MSCREFTRSKAPRNRISFLPALPITSTEESVDTIHEARSLQRELVIQMAVAIGSPVPSSLSPNDLDDWIVDHLLEYRASSISKLLGIRRPGNASSALLREWVENWKGTYEAMIRGQVNSGDLTRLRSAWLLEASHSPL